MIETATRSELVEKMMDLMLEEVRHIVAASGSKKIIIYGAGARGIILFEIMKAMGREAAYFIDSNKMNTSVCSTAVHEPMQIKHENLDDIFVVVAANQPDEMIEVLRGFGLDHEINVACIFDGKKLDNGSPHNDPYNSLDFFLGHTRVYELPGFKYLGNKHLHDFEDTHDLRIVILGNSTTDPCVVDPVDWDANNREYGAGSWPRIFHELLIRQGIKNSIYNGAIAGYSSAQEALKLVRDVLNLKPDIIITFSGLNDVGSFWWFKNKYPKFHSFFKDLDAAVEPLLPGLAWSSAPGFVKDICYGIEPSVSPFEEWSTNQRIMHAVCDEFNIEHAVFLQPPGLSQDEYLQSCDVRFRTRWFVWKFFETTGAKLHGLAGDQYSELPNRIEVKELLSHFHSDVFDYSVDGKPNFTFRLTAIDKFYHKAKEIVDRYEYIIDITDALNGYPDAFYDQFHCTVEGNKLIAERMYNELTSNGILDKALAKVAARNH